MGRGIDLDQGTHPESLIGRRREFAALRSTFASAVDGSGQLVVLTGEPGVGKTRLAEEFAAWAQEEVALVIRGRCREGEGAPAYGPWVEALGGLAAILHDEDVTPELGRLVPRLAVPGAQPPPPEGEDRFQVFNGVVDALRIASGRVPVVMLVDDVQWADRSSAQLLAHVVPELEGLALLIVATSRSGGLRRGSPWRDALAHIAQDPAYVALDVPPLSPDDVAHLLESATGAPVARRFVDAVHQRTGGNAFFVDEVIRTLLEDGAIEEHRAVERLATVPLGVRAVVGQRLDRLSPAAVEVLGAAATVGLSFSPELAARASGTPLDVANAALDEAAEAEVVGPEPAPSREWRFVHAIVRDVVAADIPASRRTAL